LALGTSLWRFSLVK
ncbi:proline dehydrogenase family protein, partial [Vibrio parahaemolyticus EKP-028]